MKINLAAFTAAGHTYPEYLSINSTPDGRIEITIREQVDLSGEHPKCGYTAAITISEEDFRSVLDQLNKKV